MKFVSFGATLIKEGSQKKKKCLSNFPMLRLVDFGICQLSAKLATSRSILLLCHFLAFIIVITYIDSHTPWRQTVRRALVHWQNINTPVTMSQKMQVLQKALLRNNS